MDPGGGKEGGGRKEEEREEEEREEEEREEGKRERKENRESVERKREEVTYNNCQLNPKTTYPKTTYPKTNLKCAVEDHHKQGEGEEPEEVPGEVGEPVDCSVHPTHQLQVLDLLGPLLNHHQNKTSRNKPQRENGRQRIYQKADTLPGKNIQQTS